MRHFLARPVRAHPIRVTPPAVPRQLKTTARLAYLTPNRLSRTLQPAVAVALVADPAQQEPPSAQGTKTLNEISKVQATARAAVDLEAESWDSTELEVARSLFDRSTGRLGALTPGRPCFERRVAVLRRKPVGCHLVTLGDIPRTPARLMAVSPRFSMAVSTKRGAFAPAIPGRIAERSGLRSRRTEPERPRESGWST